MSDRESKRERHLVRVEGLNKTYDRRLILVVLMIALTMALLQVSSVNVILDTLSESLGASTAQLQWVLSGYALAIGIVLVPAGRLGDMFGRRLVFIIGLGAFAVTSALCGLANDPTTLNFLRILQGISAGIYSPQTTGIIQQFFAGQARARAYAIMGMVIGATFAAGPVLVGFLIGVLGPNLGWRISFFLNLPLGIIGIITAAFWLPVRGKRTPAQREDAKKRIDLDPMGMFLLAAAVVCVMLPFILKTAWYLLPVSAALLAVWVWWESRYKAKGAAPMVDLSLFKLKSFTYCTAITAIQFLGQTSTFAIFAIYLQKDFGYPALIAGLVFLPNAIASSILSVVSGRYSIRYGRAIQVFALLTIITGIGLTIGAAWMFVSGYSHWWMAATLTLLGLGQGAMGSSNMTQSMLDVPASEGGISGGIQQTVQRIATAIGNTVLTATFFALGGISGDALLATQALSVAYGVAIACIATALGVAIVYWRRGGTSAASVPVR